MPTVSLCDVQLFLAALRCVDMQLVAQIRLQSKASVGSMCDMEYLDGIDKQCLSFQR